jgi:photosystem II stability/assembly factor-like uncharacterized protein
MLASNAGWLAGNAGVIYRFNGSSWLRQTSGTNRDLNDVAMYGTSLGYAVGAYETICKYNGARWSRVHQGLVITGLKSVAVISPTDIWAVGGQGLAVHYNGSSLSYASTPVTVTLNGVSFLNPFNGWAVGNGGYILHYTSGTAVSPASLGRVKALYQ